MKMFPIEIWKHLAQIFSGKCPENSAHNGRITNFVFMKIMTKISVELAILPIEYGRQLWWTAIY